MWRHLIPIAMGGGLFVATLVVLPWAWWMGVPLSLILAAVVWVMLSGPASPKGDVVPGLSWAEHRDAMRRCRRASMELKRLSRKLAPAPTMATTLLKLADVIEKIGKSYKEDPQDILHTRGFTDHHLDKLMEIVRDYVRLREADLDEESKARLKEIAKIIDGYLPRFEEIHQACVKRDFNQLEISTKALDQIMESERPG